MSNFREYTLAQLDDTFHLKQIYELPSLQQWLARKVEITVFEQQTIRYFQHKLLIGVHDWNEFELAYNFIGPIMALVDYTTDTFNFFVERKFEGAVDGITITGRPDGIIASGFREPKKPYFCFQEYKRENDPEGDPAGQCLAAMLVAQELNQHQHPVYGAYVSGRSWFFMTLEGRQYSLSDAYVATREDIFDIFRILKALKQIITELTQQDQFIIGDDSK